MISIIIQLAVRISLIAALLITASYNYEEDAVAREPRFVLQWGTAGDGQGEFHSPICVAVDKSDDVFVADLNNARVQQFTDQGALIGQFDLPRDDAGRKSTMIGGSTSTQNRNESVFNIEIFGEHVYQVGKLGLLVHNTYGEVSGTATANPKSLLPRQGAGEMTPSRLQEMAEDMMIGQFPWGRTGPVLVAEGPNGARIILDGHHRTGAAIEAGLESIPIEITHVTPDVWIQLMQEVLLAAGTR